MICTNQAEYNRQMRYAAATFPHPSLIPPSPFEPPYEPIPDPSIPIRVIPLEVGGMPTPAVACATPAAPQQQLLPTFQNQVLTVL